MPMGLPFPFKEYLNLDDVENIDIEDYAAILGLVPKNNDSKVVYRKPGPREDWTETEFNGLIASTVKIARTRRKLTQQQVADQLGISIPTYGRYERGLAPFPVNALLQLCELFDCTFEEITCELRSHLYPSTISGEMATALILMISSLPENSITVIYNLVLERISVEAKYKDITRHYDIYKEISEKFDLIKKSNLNNIRVLFDPIKKTTISDKDNKSSKD